MTDPARIKLLFALISYATVLVVQAGMVRNNVKKIKIKNHGRPVYSLFTYGLDLWRTLFRETVPSYFRPFLDLLLPPSKTHPVLPQSGIENYAL